MEECFELQVVEHIGIKRTINTRVPELVDFELLVSLNFMQHLTSKNLLYR